MVQTLRIDSPQLKAYLESMTPQQRAKMSRSGNPMFSGAPQVTTVYLRGGKSRADIGPMTYVSDAATNQTTVIEPARAYLLDDADAAPAGAGQISATVKDTGQTKVIQGHPSRRYFDDGDAGLAARHDHPGRHLGRPGPAPAHPAGRAARGRWP